MRERYEELKVVYFQSVDKSKADYSGSYTMMKVFIDWETKEVVTRLTSNWNSSYDVEEKVKF